eukprot:1136928-Pelagomonas_calceolata.AAC.1
MASHSPSRANKQMTTHTRVPPFAYTQIHKHTHRDAPPCWPAWNSCPNGDTTPAAPTRMRTRMVEGKDVNSVARASMDATTTTDRLPAMLFGHPMPGPDAAKGEGDGTEPAPQTVCTEPPLLLLPRPWPWGCVPELSTSVRDTDERSRVRRSWGVRGASFVLVPAPSSPPTTSCMQKRVREGRRMYATSGRWSRWKQKWRAGDQLIAAALALR